MEITKIDGKPYSEDIENKISTEEDELSRLLVYSHGNSTWSSFPGRKTIKFTRNDEDEIQLYFRNSFLFINNITDYNSKPKLNYLKNIFHSKLVKVKPSTFNDVQNFLMQVNIENIIGKGSIIRETDVDPDTSCFEKKSNTYKISTPNLDFQELTNWFLRRKYFDVDLASEVRFETRKNEDYHFYTISLKTKVYSKTSGSRGITEYDNKIIQVKAFLTK